jgi:hypothetical protein
MDGEPGFVEPGGRIKTGQGKKQENSLVTPATGVSFLLGTFLWTSKEKYLASAKRKEKNKPRRVKVKIPL